MASYPQPQLNPDHEDSLKPGYEGQEHAVVAGGVQGYAVHTGEGRSTADVTVRDGSAPIMDREDVPEEAASVPRSNSIPSSGNAPA